MISQNADQILNQTMQNHHLRAMKGEEERMWLQTLNAAQDKEKILKREADMKQKIQMRNTFAEQIKNKALTQDLIIKSL